MGPNAGAWPRASIVSASEEKPRLLGNTGLAGKPRTCTRLNLILVFDLVREQKHYVTSCPTLVLTLQHNVRSWPYTSVITRKYTQIHELDRIPTLCYPIEGYYT